MQAYSYPRSQRDPNTSRIVGEMLHWNTRLYLDSFRNNQSGLSFETNTDVNNAHLSGSPIQSVLHMILNPRFMRNEVTASKLL
jgi:hypothetical protein